MKTKKNNVRTRSSTILFWVVGIMLFAAPQSRAQIDWAEGQYYNDGTVHDVKENLYWLEVGNGTTVNLYASVALYVYVYPGSVLNIYSGDIPGYVMVDPGLPHAVVRIYGTDFKVNDEPVDYGQVVISSVLTGTYGNGDSINLKIYSLVPIYLEMPDDPDDPEVKIDIKPGSSPNSINLKSKGVVPVAVLTDDEFDAGTVDPKTVEFAGAKPVRSKLCDVDDDGDEDMLLHFKTQDLELNKDSTEATLTGKTDEGVAITGTDTVRIVPKKK
jgi:hypothetical protein